jgi:peptide/nickel transport system permease protein
VAAFIIRRVLAALLVVILTSMFVFALFFLGPSDPARPFCDLNGRCTPEKLEILTHQMGLDDNVAHQYAIFVKGIFVDREVQLGAKFDCEAPCLGYSFSTREPVTKDLVDKYPATLSLAIGGATIYLTLGLLLGSLAARFRGTASDRLLVGSSLIVSAIPYYVFALIAWIFLSLQWGIFPDTSYVPLRENPALWFSHLLLPWLVLGVSNSTQYARFSRGQMVETLGEDYIRTAVAKGVRKERVIFQHALRAAIVPVITIFGLDFATLLGGTVFTETIFDIDGIGNWGIQALRNPLDFPVITATVLVASLLVVTANLIVDILYGFLDPRVRVA